MPPNTVETAGQGREPRQLDGTYTSPTREGAEMKASNPFHHQRRLIALSLIAAAIILAMLAAGMTAWAENDNLQRAAVTGLSATPGTDPGEIDLSWDAHPAGAKDYRVAWAPGGESFRRASDTNWNAKPTATGMTITGLTGGDDYKVKVRARFDSNPRSRWSSVATATATEADDPPPPVIQPPEPTPTPDHAEGHSSPHHLSISDASATEGDDITFTVTLHPVSTDDVTFDLDTSRQSDDNAEGNDFTAVHSTFTITAGQTSTTFTVATRDDGHNTPTSVYEGDETFTVTISNPTNAEIALAVAKGTIIDNEQIPIASFVRSSHRVSEQPISLTDAISIDIAPVNERWAQLSLVITGSAEAGEDYSPIVQTLTVSVGQSVIRAPIHLIDDNKFEFEENIIIRMVAASDNIRVDPNANTTELFIDNDDPDPTVRVVSVQAGAEGGQNTGAQPVPGQDFANVVFEFQMSQAAGATLKAKVEIIDGTAVAGADYQDIDPRIIFEEGTTRTYIKVPVIDDNQFEGRRNETFTLRVYEPNHLVLGTGGELLITGEIRDNEEPPAGADYVSDDTDTTATIAAGESWLHGNPVPGRIEEQNDQDWYLTNLRAGRCYQIEIRGKSDAEGELPGAEGLTLTDPYLNGVYRDDGVYLPGTTNRDGGVDLSALHTIRFNKTGAYYIAVSHGWYDEGGTFDLSVINLGARTKTCTEVDVDNLTYKPGTFDSK